MVHFHAVFLVDPDCPGLPLIDRLPLDPRLRLASMDRCATLGESWSPEGEYEGQHHRQFPKTFTALAARAANAIESTLHEFSPLGCRLHADGPTMHELCLH
jgi:hypothetical protein